MRGGVAKWNTTDKAAVGSDAVSDIESRFRTLVQSPLRAGLLRFLAARVGENFDLDALMAAFGRLRLDVQNCVGELVDFGVARRLSGEPARFTFARPGHPDAIRLIDTFLEGRATVSTEDQSPSVQRFREMIGRDEKMLVVFEWIRTAAKSDISVLILGPTGSGKELVAGMIHDLSRRSHARFQAVNCAALPDTLFESELFGYEKGAFTGAHDRKPGRLEMANEGTLFLDEIGDLSIVAQAKLLRVLEERRFERLGGNRSIAVDFRLISATNRPLDLFVRDERFREDLFYRVNAFSIRLPSLRERPVDIPVLAQRFLARVLRVERTPPRRQGVQQGRHRPADRLSVARQHPGAREHRVPRGAVGAGPTDPRRRHRVPQCRCPPARRRRALARLHAPGRRTRPHPARAGVRRLEQEGSRRPARHQPRHPLSQDRGVRAHTRNVPKRDAIGCRFSSSILGIAAGVLQNRTTTNLRCASESTDLCLPLRFRVPIRDIPLRELVSPSAPPSRRIVLLTR